MNSFGLLLRIFLLLGATIVIVGGGASIVRMVLIAEYNVSDRLTSLSVSEELLQDEVCKRLRLAYVVSARPVVEQVQRDFPFATELDAYEWIGFALKEEWQTLDITPSLKVQMRLFEKTHSRLKQDKERLGCRPV